MRRKQPSRQISSLGLWRVNGTRILSLTYVSVPLVRQVLLILILRLVSENKQVSASESLSEDEIIGQMKYVLQLCWIMHAFISIIQRSDFRRPRHYIRGTDQDSSCSLSRPRLANSPAK